MHSWHPPSTPPLAILKRSKHVKMEWIRAATSVNQEHQESCSNGIKHRFQTAATLAMLIAKIDMTSVSSLDTLDDDRLFDSMETISACSKIGLQLQMEAKVF